MCFDKICFKLIVILVAFTNFILACEDIKTGWADNILQFFVLDEIQGTIKSPNYPNEYAPNLSVTWNIKSPPGTVILNYC